MGNIERFRISPETNKVVSRLEAAEVGDIIHYEELSELVFGDIQKGKRHHLDSARRILQTQKHMLFGTIVNVGVKLLNDQEVVMDGFSGISSIRRYSQRTARKYACIKEYGVLSEEEKKLHNTTLSVMGAVTLFTKAKNLKAIGQAVKEKRKQIDISDTLSLFK